MRVYTLVLHTIFWLYYVQLVKCTYTKWLLDKTPAKLVIYTMSKNDISFLVRKRHLFSAQNNTDEENESVNISAW